MSERFIRRGRNWERYGSPSTPVAVRETVLYRDNFEGTQVDRSRWGVNVLPAPAERVEDHWNREANVAVSSGSLQITTLKETVNGPVELAPAVAYTSADGVNRAAPRTGLQAGTRPFSSGMVSSGAASTPRYYPLFSRFEIRARVPHGQGLLPAFRLVRKGGGSWAEVDVMEYFGNYRPGETKFSLQFPNSLGANLGAKYTPFERPQPGSSGWFTWWVEIRPALEHADPLKDPVVFTAFLDGVPAGSYKLTNEQALRDLHMVDRVSGERPQSGDREVWDVTISQAVGGRWVGAPDQQLGYLPLVDRCSRTQAAPPSGATSCDLTDLFFANLPAVFEIDHVSITDLGFTA